MSIPDKSAAPCWPALIEAEALIPSLATEAPMPALSFQLPATGICCLLGLDGSKLDVYLRALGGIVPIREGHLRLFGQSTNTIDAASWIKIRMKLGYISQGAPLLSVISGLENVVLPSVYHGIYSRSDAITQAGLLLQKLCFEGDTSLLPAYMSPLQRTQLALARAVILEPAALLLNEPYHELELQDQTIIDDFLQEWCTEHALLIATRNLRLVRTMANNIVFFTEHTIHQFASWEALCQSECIEVSQYLQRHHDLYDL